MRSISYIVTNKPYNRSDCFDYRSKSSIYQISIELDYNFRISEMYHLTHLEAIYIWTFEDGCMAKYIESYGGIFDHENLDRKQKSIDNANRRMMNMISDIERRTGLEIINREKRFEMNSNGSVK